MIWNCLWRICWSTEAFGNVNHEILLTKLNHYKIEVNKTAGFYLFLKTQNNMFQWISRHLPLGKLHPSNWPLWNSPTVQLPPGILPHDQLPLNNSPLTTSPQKISPMKFLPGQLPPTRIFTDRKITTELSPLDDYPPENWLFHNILPKPIAP